jgi:hypothetical protein
MRSPNNESRSIENPGPPRSADRTPETAGDTSSPFIYIATRFGACPGLHANETPSEET